MLEREGKRNGTRRESHTQRSGWLAVSMSERLRVFKTGDVGHVPRRTLIGGKRILNSQSAIGQMKSVCATAEPRFSDPPDLT